MDRAITANALLAQMRKPEAIALTPDTLELAAQALAIRLPYPMDYCRELVAHVLANVCQGSIDPLLRDQ